MALVFYLTVALGLWVGTDAKCTNKGCCLACREGWTELHYHCYKFINDPKNWDAAENDCIDRGGNLASIHDATDYNALLDLVKTSTGYDRQTWIGGYDSVREGHWKWADGTEFNFKFWGPGQPNNYKGQHCLELNFALDRDKPNDWFCYSLRPYICARDMEIRDLI